MKVVKSVVRAVWPIIFSVLNKYAQKTETLLDDIGLSAANAAVQEWLDDTEDDVTFE